MQLNSLDYVLWVASFAGNILLLSALLYRRFALRIPIFTTWIAFSIVRTIVLYLVNRNLGLSSYFYVYWTLQAFEVFIELGIVAEATLKVFRPLGTLVPDAKQPMVAIVALSVLVATALSLLAAPPARLSIETTVMRGDLFSFALLSELFAGFVYLSRTAGLSWSPHVTRAVMGFGVYALVSFISVGFQNVFGISDRGEPYKILSWAQIFAYLCSLTYWIASFSRKPEPAKAMSPEVKAQLERLSAGWALVLQTLQLVPHE